MQNEELLFDIYESLKGCRMKHGMLNIPGFSESDYEDLYFAILELLEPVFKGNYEGWFKQQMVYFRRYRVAHSGNPDMYEPFLGREIIDLTIQEQLVVLKFYLYRQKHSIVRRPKRRKGYVR